MANDFLEILVRLVFGILILSLLADTFLSVTWNRIYFTIGVQIFIIRVPVDLKHKNTPTSTLLQSQFKSGCAESLIFKEIGPGEFGFREEIFPVFKIFSYSPLMHGLLVFDSQNSQVIVKGNANWSTLVFSFVWFLITISNSIHILVAEGLSLNLLLLLGFMGLIIVVPVAIYQFQSSRFTRVASFAAQSWERKFLPLSGGVSIPPRL